MVILVQRRDGHRDEYRVSSVSDFFPILERYPSLTNAVVMSRTLREAADVVAEYMNRYHVNAWIEGDDMHKSAIGTAAAAIGLGAAAFGVGHPTHVKDIHDQPKPAIVTKQSDQPFGSKKEDAFLWNIKQIESANGQNTDHPTVKTGMHRGQSAIGKWALMPQTVTDLHARLQKLGRSNEDLDHLASLQPEAMRAYLDSRPDIELGLARFLARHLLQRHHGDEQRAAYAWLHGHNLYPTDISDNDLKHEYVQRYNAFNEKNPMRQHRTPASVKKSATQKIPSTEQFTQDLSKWMKMREIQDNKPMLDDTFVPDPGRIRNDNEYRKPTAAELVRDYAIARKK